jgi:hypothetical protein
VEKVFELERELERTRRRLRALERESARVREELERELETVRRSYRAELVRYEPPGSALVPARRVARRRPSV